MTIPEGRKPMTDSDMAALTRKLADTAIEQSELYQAAKRDAEEAEAYAAELEAKLTWQPIETAPKDGTTVLTYPNYIVTHYETEEAYPCPGWAVSWDDCMDAYITMRTPPTHWMELPDEPKETDE